MAENIDLNINIGANVTDLQSQLQKAENLLKQFEAALKKATNVGEINYLNNQVKNLNGTITSLNQQMNKVGRPVGDATTALSNLSRVAQDAPYGFIGIANNLNPLLESFQQLQKKSGSATEALKAMAGGLIGPAGIGLALGVVSSLAVTFSDEIAEFFKGPTEKLKSFREELKKLNEEIYKIVGEAQSNRTVGLNLVNVISGGNPTQQQEALKRLKALYSDNAAIKEATIKTDKNYLIHLVNVASKQQEFAGKEKNTQDVLDAAYARRKKLEAERETAVNNVKATTSGGEKYNKTKTDEARKRVSNSFNAGFAEIDKDIATAKKKNLELNTTLTGIETPDGKGGNQREKKDPFAEITKDFDKSLKAQEILRSKGIIDQQTYLNNLYKIYEDYIKKLAELGTSTATKKLDSLLPKFDKMTLEKNAKEIKDGIKDALSSNKESGIEIPIDNFAISQKNLEKEKNKIETFLLGIKEKKVADKYKKEQDNLDELTKSYESFANSVANFGGNIAQTLFQPLQEGETVLDNLSKLFKQLAADILAATIRAVIFEAVMASLNVASGGASSGGGFVKRLLGLASGGIATGPTLAMIGEGSESEAVLPLSKLGNVMQSSFNAGSMSGNAGSGGGGVAVLRGQDLLVAINRTQRASALKGQNISLA